MSDNNMMYQMYRQMTQGYKLGKDGENLFEHAVKCWLDINPENPFQEDSEAFEHFFRMKNYYGCWKLNGADKKINMRRMLNAAKDLCATKTKNPYKFDKKAAEAEKLAAKEDAAKAQEEYLKYIQDAERQKAEHDEEVRRIMEELNSGDIENQERINSIKTTVEEVETKFNNEKSEASKRYVFNVLDIPEKELDVTETEDSEPNEKTEKKGWLRRLLKR